MIRKIICGIYKITSPSGRVYIGQSIDIITRWGVYKRAVNKSQILLYNSFLKYGVDNHVFEIIEECVREELNDLEIFYEKLYDATNPKTGMNMKGCGDKGWMSEESKLKISKSHIGIGHSEKTKQRLRETSTGNKNCVGRIVPEETKFKIRETLTGRKLSTEHKQNAINGRKHYKHSEETIAKIKATNLGQKRSDEARKNMSLAHIGIKQSKELIEKRVKNMRRDVLDTKTGTIYSGVRVVCELFGFKYSTLMCNLNGNAKNRTSFVYLPLIKNK